jgi:hypothetical protein
MSEIPERPYGDSHRPPTEGSCTPPAGRRDTREHEARLERLIAWRKCTWRSVGRPAFESIASERSRATCQRSADAQPQSELSRKRRVDSADPRRNR